MGNNDTSETWRAIFDYDGLYEISNFGRVRSLDRVVLHKNGKRQPVAGRILVPVQLGGYHIVTLCKQGQFTAKSVHRLVAEAFIPNLDNKPHVNHIDGDKQNNHVSNLEWCTARENNEHAWKHKLNRNHPQPVQAINKISGAILEFASVLSCSTSLRLPSVSQCLDNGTDCGDYSLSYIDTAKAEKVAAINRTKQPIGGNTPMPVRCVTTGEVFPSVRKCSEYFRIDDETIRRALRYSHGHVRKYKLDFEFVGR